jgi:hypothetical protein
MVDLAFTDRPDPLRLKHAPSREGCCPYSASVIPGPLCASTFTSNLLNRARARRAWQASIDFAQGPHKEMSRGYVRVPNRATSSIALP